MPSKQNPADIGSRGMLASELVTCDLWWHGPQFLFKSAEPRERFQVNYTNDDYKKIQEEYRPATAAKVSVCQPRCFKLDNVSLIERFSSLSKIVRITAYVLKAIKPLKE